MQNHNPGDCWCGINHRRAAALERNAEREQRDATAGELHDESDAILQDLANGWLGATLTTQRLAREELAYRRLRTRT